MRNFLKSLFGRGDEAQPSAPRSNEAASKPAVDVPVDAPEAPAANPARTFAPAGSLADILAELVAQVCETMPDPRTPEEIDTELHMYDAGYVTSITAADLLTHIDARYGVDISETKLIGPLQNLSALAKHIQAHTSE